MTERNTDSEEARASEASSEPLEKVTGAEPKKSKHYDTLLLIRNAINHQTQSIHETLQALEQDPLNAALKGILINQLSFLGTLIQNKFEGHGDPIYGGEKGEDIIGHTGVRSDGVGDLLRKNDDLFEEINLTHAQMQILHEVHQQQDDIKYQAANDIADNCMDEDEINNQSLLLLSGSEPLAAGTNALLTLSNYNKNSFSSLPPIDREATEQFSNSIKEQITSVQRRSKQLEQAQFDQFIKFLEKQKQKYPSKREKYENLHKALTELKNDYIKDGRHQLFKDNVSDLLQEIRPEGQLKRSYSKTYQNFKKLHGSLDKHVTDHQHSLKHQLEEAKEAAKAKHQQESDSDTASLTTDTGTNTRTDSDPDPDSDTDTDGGHDSFTHK